MKKFFLAAAMAALMSGTALAPTKIGVSMALFDDNFLTVLRNGIDAQSKDLAASKCRSKMRRTTWPSSLTRSRTSPLPALIAIIVNPVDTSATQAMTDAAAAAKIPLVYVNRQPINVDTLPDDQAFVASNEEDSGTLETIEVCRLFKEAGKTEANVYVMMGELSNQAAVQRTKDIHDVMASRQVRREAQHHRRADRQLVARRGPEPDDQLALGRQAV